MCEGLHTDPRTKEQEALPRPGRLQLVLRTLIDMEIKFAWALLAVHSQLKEVTKTGLLVGEVEEWMVLSRVRLRACVDRLGKRFGSLLVSFILSRPLVGRSLGLIVFAQALSMRPGHLSRFVQFLGHTLEVIGRVYVDSPTRFVAGDGPKAAA